MKGKRANLGVSDVVAVIMLLGMTVALFSVVSIVVLSYPFSPNPPTANLVGFIGENNNIILEHRGGEDIGLDAKIIVTIGDSERYQMNISDGYILSNNSKNNNLWNIGENIIIDPSIDLPNIDISTTKVDITVVDANSDSVILMGTLREGDIIISPTPPGPEPLVKNPYPADDATGVELTPTLSIDVEDPQGDNLDIEFMTNESAIWQQIGSTQNGGNDTYTQSTSGVFDDYDMEYWWRVNVNDGVYTTTKTYHFSTGSLVVPLTTQVDPISPYEITTPTHAITATGDSRLDDVTLWYRWSEDNIHWSDSFESITVDETSSTEWEDYFNQVYWSHRVENHENRILIVVSSVEEDNSGDHVISSITYNGDPLTKADSAEIGSSIIASSEIWYLLNPDVGTHDIIINYNGGPIRYCAAGAISFYNVAQQAPEVTNTNTSTSTSSINTDITALSDGSIIIDNVACGANSGFLPGTDQTEFYEERTSGAGAAGAGSYKELLTAGATSMTQTASFDVNRMAHVVVAFAPVSYSGIDWTEWSDTNNPDEESPWSWGFYFPEGEGYYEFYSIGRYSSGTEAAPGSADASCYYNPN